jgi:hypothetical protein
MEVAIDGAFVDGAGSGTAALALIFFSGLPGLRALARRRSGD